MKNQLEKYYNINLNKFPEVDLNVLEFIKNFRTSNSIREEVLEDTFMRGYCYYFANILKTAFERGYIAVTAPYGHIVWVDNEIGFDINGISTSSGTFIPIEHLGRHISDFKHVPGEDSVVTIERDIQQIIELFDSTNPKDSPAIHREKLFDMLSKYVDDKSLNYKITILSVNNLYEVFLSEKVSHPCDMVPIILKKAREHFNLSNWNQLAIVPNKIIENIFEIEAYDNNGIRSGREMLRIKVEYNS